MESVEFIFFLLSYEEIGLAVAQFSVRLCLVTDGISNYIGCFIFASFALEH